MPINNVKYGSNFKYVEPVNLYDCEIKDDVFVGPFVEIQNNVKIGSGTRVQSHSFICSQVVIGKDCFIGHGVVFINDKFHDGKPANRDKKKWSKTTINSKVYIGSNSTILPVTICSNVVIGAGLLLLRHLNIW